MEEKKINKRRIRQLVVVLVTSALAAGCATWQNTTLAGAATGAGIGLTYGIAGNYDDRSTLILGTGGTILGFGLSRSFLSSFHLDEGPWSLFVVVGK